MPSPTKIKSIVCTLDLASSASREITAWSVAATRLLGADLCLFHAIAPRGDPLHPTAEFEYGGGLQTRREARLAQLNQLMQEAEHPFCAEVVTGEPAEALQRLCRSRPVDLVVAGSQSIRGFKRLLMGTVVERLAHMTLCPLLFLRPKRLHPAAIAQIGICCDFSEGDARLIGYGQELARAFRSRIHLLHAMEAAVDDSLVDSTQGPYQEVQQLLQKRIEQKLLDREKAMPAPAAAVGARAVPGSIFGLLDVAADLQIDLLVVGVRRHSLVDKLVVGSSTDAALRRARCHVLTVPLQARTRPAPSNGGPEPAPDLRRRRKDRAG